MCLQYFLSDVRSIKHKEWLYSRNNFLLFVFNASEIDIDTRKLLFEDAIIKDPPKQIQFMDIPFVIMARKNLTTLMELIEIDP